MGNYVHFKFTSHPESYQGNPTGYRTVMVNGELVKRLEKIEATLEKIALNLPDAPHAVVSSENMKPLKEFVPEEECARARYLEKKKKEELPIDHPARFMTYAQAYGSDNKDDICRIEGAVFVVIGILSAVVAGVLIWLFAKNILWGLGIVVAMAVFWPILSIVICTLLASCCCSLRTDTKK